MISRKENTITAKSLLKNLTAPNSKPPQSKYAEDNVVFLKTVRFLVGEPLAQNNIIFNTIITDVFVVYLTEKRLQVTYDYLVRGDDNGYG